MKDKVRKLYLLSDGRSYNDVFGNRNDVIKSMSRNRKTNGMVIKTDDYLMELSSDSYMEDLLYKKGIIKDIPGGKGKQTIDMGAIGNHIVGITINDEDD